MALLDDLQRKFALNAFEFSRHALDQSLRIVTVYDPDPSLWDNLRVRKTADEH